MLRRYCITIDIYVIGAVKAPESYSTIAEAFGEIIQQVNEMIASPVIDVDEVEYKMEFYLCSDYKVCSLIQFYRHACWHSCIHFSEIFSKSIWLHFGSKGKSISYVCSQKLQFAGM